MRTYYSGPDALITDEHFIWSSYPERVYAVSRLRNTGIVCDPDAGILRRVLLISALLLGGAVTYAGTTLGSLAPVAFGTAALLLVGAGALGRRPRRSWHLQALYHGRTTLIYSSTDERVFHQVARALLRTIEDSPGRDGLNLRSVAA